LDCCITTVIGRRPRSERGFEAGLLLFGDVGSFIHWQEHVAAFLEALQLLCGGEVLLYALPKRGCLKLLSAPPGRNHANHDR
jgi:hypothetical protein